MNPTRILAVMALALLTACTGPDVRDAQQQLPERVLLHYDFSGDWMAAAGDQCRERLDISDTVFLSIAHSPDGSRNRYHIVDFFMLEPGEPAEAVVGAANADGRLKLAVETEGTVDGQQAIIDYELVLEQENAEIARLREFIMTVRDNAGRSTETDLLAEAARDPSIPILGVRGSRGLCLKRLPL